MAGENIKIITGNRPPKLVAFAAAELKRYIGEIFGREALLTGRTGIPDDEGISFILTLNESLADNFGSVWKGEKPSLSDQGFVIRRSGRSIVCLVGGSPVAVLWSVYELAGSWGVFFGLRGDVLPKRTDEMKLPDGCRVYEPRQRVRSWRMMNALMTGAESWSLAQQRRVIAQLVKHKFNGIHVNLWAQHPFVDFCIDGISKKSASFNFGIPIPITEDNIGKGLLGQKDLFVNPEFKGCGSYQEYRDIGKMYMDTLISCAKEYDMDISAAFQPFDFTKEYAPLLEKPVAVNQLGNLFISEGGNIFNPSHTRLLKAQFDACISTYPQIGSFTISFPEHARDAVQYSEALSSLDRKFGIASKYDIEDHINDAASGYLAAGGPKRAAEEARMSLVMLDVLHKLMEVTGIVKELDVQGKRMYLSAGMSCPKMLPVIADALWEDAGLCVVTGYTASRGARQLMKLGRIDASKIRIQQVLTLQDDNIGYLPQLSTASIHRLLEFGIGNGWEGYTTRYWPIGDLDPVTEYLSSASWNIDTTPESAHAAYSRKLFGKESVSEIGQALRLLEDATILLDTDHLTLLFPARIIMEWLIGPERKSIMTESLWHIRGIYDEVKAMLNRQLVKTYTQEGKIHMLQWINRMDFSIKALDGLSMIDKGNMALASGKRQDAERYYGNASDHFRQALESLAGNIREESDIGALAIYYDVLVREFGKKTAEVLRME